MDAKASRRECPAMHVTVFALLVVLLTSCVASTSRWPVAFQSASQTHLPLVMVAHGGPARAGRPRVHEARQTIESTVRAAVPPGVSRAHVEAWLKSQGMEIQTIDAGSLRESDTWKLLQDRSFRPSDAGGMIISFRRQSVRGSVFLATLLFFLDRKGVLMECSVENVRDAERRRMPAKPTAAEIRRAIRSALAVRSSRETVAAWLEKKGIRHSYLSAKTHNLRHVSVVRDSRLAPSLLGGITQATVPHVAEQGYSRIDVQMTFFFDRKNRLIASSVTEIGVGP
jgi:hypothetical protein